MLCGYTLHKDTGSLVLVSRYNVSLARECCVCMQNGLSLLGAVASVNLATHKRVSIKYKERFWMVPQHIPCTAG